MLDRADDGGRTEPPIVGRCAWCSKDVATSDCVTSGSKVFCRTCHEARAELENARAGMSADINYVNASLGALLGGIVGVLLWWGITTLTNMALGLVAVAIGFCVGYGTVKLTGGKRSGGLQAISVAVSLASYLFAAYLVNMTYINRVLAEEGEAIRVVFPPQNFEIFRHVLLVNFGLWDLIFLGIVVYEAWAIPKPVAIVADETPP